MIQQKLIDWVLNPLAKQMNRLPDVVRSIIFVLAAVAMLTRYLFHDMLFSGLPYFLVYIISCLCLGVMLLTTLPETLKPIRLRTVPAICWYGTGAIMVVTSCLYNRDWLSDALMFVLICPIVFLIWGNADHGRILRRLSRACVISFIIFMIASMIFVPVQDRQYAGLFCNVNGTALYLILVFACLLIEVLRTHRKRWILILHYLLLGICGTLIFYTNSRTGQMAAILALIAAFGLSLLRDWSRAKGKILLKLLCVVLVLAVTLPTTVHLFRAGNQFVRSLASLSQSESGTDVKGDFSTFLEHNNLKNQTEGKDMEAMSTGRIGIWREYLKASTLFGSDTPEQFWIESRQAYYSTAHMTWITYAFRHGFICAGLFLAYNLMMGVAAVVFAWRNKGDYLALLPLTVTVVFGVASLLASVNTPFNYMVTIYYYFVQTPLLVKGFKEDKNHDQTVV